MTIKEAIELSVKENRIITVEVTSYDDALAEVFVHVEDYENYASEYDEDVVGTTYEGEDFRLSLVETQSK